MTMANKIVPFLAPEPGFEHPQGPVPRSLYLYTCMLRTKAESVHRQGVLTAPTETTDAGYIGLRETIAGAVERARMFDRHVQNDTHCILEVEFSPHGIAFFTMNCQGPDRKFESTLFKKNLQG